MRGVGSGCQRIQVFYEQGFLFSMVRASFPLTVRDTRWCQFGLSPSVRLSVRARLFNSNVSEGS